MTDTEPTVAVGKTAPATNLDYVFDDPEHGEPGRDRMLVHGLWELVLLLALGAVGYLLYAQNGDAYGGDGLRGLLLSASTLGAVAAAAAISMRAGVPNLAIGAVAAASGLYYAHNSGAALVTGLLIVIGLTAAIGAVQGLVSVSLHVPSWAVSLAVGLGVFAWAAQQKPVNLTGGYDPDPHVYYWFGGFCALSVIVSLVGLIPNVRRGFGRFRSVADPADRRGIVAAVIAIAATVASSVLAGVSGVLSVSVTHHAVASDGLTLTALAIGAALLGGTSAYGRRGGIFGTVLAVGLMTVTARYLTEVNRSWADAALAAVAIGVGLVVTRLVERFGRPSQTVVTSEEEEWAPAGHAAPSSARTPTSWASPAATTTTSTATGGLWASDEAWGSSERR